MEKRKRIKNITHKKFHLWFSERRKPEYLENYRRKYILRYNMADAFTEGENAQVIYFSFIRAVKLEEIKIDNEWNDYRIERIKSWADDDTLLRIPFDRFAGMIFSYPAGYIPSLCDV